MAVSVAPTSLGTTCLIMPLNEKLLILFSRPDSIITLPPSLQSCAYSFVVTVNVTILALLTLAEYFYSDIAIGKPSTTAETFNVSAKISLVAAGIK